MVDVLPAHLNVSRLAQLHHKMGVLSKAMVVTTKDELLLSMSAVVTIVTTIHGNKTETIQQVHNCIADLHGDLIARWDKSWSMRQAGPHKVDGG